MPTWTQLTEFVPAIMTTAERDAAWESPPNNLTIFNSTIGLYQVYSGVRWVSLAKYVTVAASASPGVGDDTDDGYVIGDRWIDTTNDKEYVCVDVTAGAAVWLDLFHTKYTNAEAVTAVKAGDTGIRHIQVRLLGPDTDCAVESTIGGDFVISIAGTLIDVFCYNDTAGVGGGPMLVDIHKGGTTVLSTKMNLDTTKKISTDSSTQPVISVSAVSNKDIFTFDIDSGIHSTAAKGLVVELAVRES